MRRSYEKIMRRNLSTLPHVAKQQTQNELTPLISCESRSTQVRLHIDQFRRRQLCRPAKKRIQNPHDRPAVQMPQTCGCDLKIRMQPPRTRRGGTCNDRHQLPQLIRTKAVEKKAGHNEIKRRWQGLPRQRVCVDELHRRASQSRTPQPRTCEVDHHHAGLHHRDPCCREATAQFGKKAPVTLTINQHLLRGGNGGQQRRATTLQLPAGAQCLHPAVMGGQQIKTHAAVRAADTTIRNLL